MDGNSWYAPSGGHDHYGNGPPHTNHSPEPNPAGLTGAAVDSVQDAQRLLAVYPMASATPTHHVSRHISTMTITAAPPTFAQPSYYAAHPNSYHRGNPPPPYSEYDQQISYLGSAQVPNDRGYWENTRNDAVRMLNEQQTQGSYSYPPMEPWAPAPTQSTYQTTPFAQSIFQRTAPSSAYPTPPPPGIMSSSSSLAYALGGGPSQCPQSRTHSQSSQPNSPYPQAQPQSHTQQFQRRPPQQQQHNQQQQQRHHQAPPPQTHPQSQYPSQQQRVYHPEESPAFFESFIERKTREINVAPFPTPSSVPIRSILPSTSPPIPPHSIVTSTTPHSPYLAVRQRPFTPSPKKTSQPDESPDPLALKSGSSIYTTPSSKKRKPVVEIQSPSFKRFQSMKNLQSTSQASVQPTKKAQSLTPHSSLASIPPPSSSSSSSSSQSQLSPVKAPSQTPPNGSPTPKKMNFAYVQIPVKPWSTPKTPVMTEKQRGKMRDRMDDTPDELGGYYISEDDSPVKRSLFDSGVKTSARRTGERDDRAPLEKLTALIEDIFEAEDSLPNDVDPSELPDIFSHLTTDCSRPLISPLIVRKLTKYIGQVARPTKRMRQAVGGANGTPRAKGRMAEVDVTMLGRLVKLLERCVKAGEDVDPFEWKGGAVKSSSVSPKKKSTAAKKGKNENRSKSVTPKGDEEEGGADIDEVPAVEEKREITEAILEKVGRCLEVARDSIFAADCCIALLGSDRLPKQLYSEELITSCLSTIKNQLTKIIYPFVEGSVETSFSLQSNNPLLHHVVKGNTTSSQSHRRQLSETFQALSSVLPRINQLVNAESVAMSDSIIIQAVYIAIGPFFVVDTGGEEKGKKDKEKESVVLRTLGKSAMRGLRLDALSLMRSIFANHEDQRSWIIEEILSSLIKLSDTKQKAGQFRLRDGRSIRTVSALLLQLVQTSAHDVRLEARQIEKARQNKFALKRQESMSESQALTAELEPFLDEYDHQEIRLYAGGLESATKAAKTIILFLTQRSGKGKATKNSNEAEYRAIFDNLIDDLLAVLHWPEWPAAGLLLNIASKFMVSSLDDVKSSSQTDSNAARTIALDHLGVIAARIRSSTLKVQQNSAESGPKYKGLKPLDEIVSHIEVKGLDKLLGVHRDVAAHLCKRSSEDQAYDSARELTAATLGLELATALKQVNVWVDDPDADDDLNIKDQKQLLAFAQKLKVALREVWKDPSSDVFDIGSDEEVLRIDRLAEEIGTIQSLRNSFHPIISIILSALDAPAIFMRTKALRALGQIVTSDATILSMPNVRRGIESHLLDSSPAVRDAAVELIGKYMIDSPEVAGDYYQKIADRMADTGLSVRKRVIKLFKSFYGVAEDNHRRIDIATRMVLRMLDEDDTVKELAMKTLEELWFVTTPLPSGVKPRSGSAISNPHDKNVLQAKVGVIMGTAANFKDRQSPLESVLHKIMAEKSGAEANSLHVQYAEICGVLIDGLVDASDLPGFTVINCIRTIYLLTSAYPAILSGINATTLLPYLGNASTNEEIATSDYLLKIFRVTIPHMPKTAAKFGQELQKVLQPMIIKPAGGGGAHLLPEAVGCMCIVVQHLTHEFLLLVNLVKSCNTRIQQYIKRPASQPVAQNDMKVLLLLIFIVSLLGENCDFEKLRQENSKVAPDIDSISRGPIVEYIYDTLLKLYNKYDNTSLRGRVLQCLGFLFRAQPTLMTKDESAKIMDAIFEAPEEDGRGKLLKIVQDFLVSEATKHSEKEKESSKGKGKPAEINMEELVGNTDGFADSGVSSAIVQRYLGPILDAALSQNLQIQTIAIDVLSFTVKQGLAHPLQSFPVIIALETSPISNLCNRASALHAILYGKHASLLNSRYIISARASFNYQKKLTTVVRGFRVDSSPVALLQRWYSLVREKRPTRQEFLKSLVKVFQENSSYESSQDDVDFTRYMAENFATFDYKTHEEVFTIIKYLTAVLSTTGMQLLEIISPSHLLTHLHGSSHNAASHLPAQSANAMDTSHDGVPNNANATHKDKPALMRTSVIIAIVMLLKAHLKALYSLSEDKCNKFVIGKKSALGDKPALKRHDHAISWERLPFATTPLLTTQDADEQKARFLDIWNEDGLTAEPEDDMA
ncbi:hypothetical protein BDQ17DRAFT_1353128 [Cyathus striatus]|nr:hypothetical protein BDQ17DRAFT_1353128 [Cyathus striatus]